VLGLPCPAEQEQARQTVTRVEKESGVHRKRLEDIKVREMAAKERMEALRKKVTVAKRSVEKLVTTRFTPSLC
jgi:septation ring formation regulator EzrA